MLKREAGWLEIRTDAHRGWVTQRYVAATLDPDTPKPDTPKKRTSSDDVGVGSPWTSRAACLETLEKRTSDFNGRGVATWNVRWFPDGQPGKKPPRNGGTDLEWLACALALLDAPVIGLQEIKRFPRADAAARNLVARMNAHTGGKWRLELDGCDTSVQQHVGILYDASRVTALGFERLDSINPYGGCGKQLRPGLLGRFRDPTGREFVVVDVHFKSGTDVRSYRLREQARAAMAREVSRARDSRPGTDLFVIGDFNTMGCEKCAPSVSGLEEAGSLAAILGEVGLRLAPANPGCTQYFRDRPGLLDHIATSRTDSAAQAEGICSATACAPIYGDTPAFLRDLSDHCPLVVHLR